jgi:hypothetical protein
MLGADTYDLKGTDGSCTELIHWNIKNGAISLAGYECFPDSN